MKTYLCMFFALLWSVSSISGQTPPYDKNWQAVFIDEFNTFNNDRWNIRYGHHGKEPQFYRADSDNTYVENGKLVLKIKKENYFCHDPKCEIGGFHPYTSGKIASKNTYRYGYFEIVCSLPTGKGFWPAFWTWNGSDSPCWYNEIDIFEMDGEFPTRTETNLHWNYECTGDLHNVSKTFYCPDYTQNYNSYSIEWHPDKFIWYVNGNAIRFEPNIYGINYPQYIVVNLAIAPWRMPDQSTPFPSYMYVDKIKYYQLKMDCNTVVNEIPNFINFNYAVKKSISLGSITSVPQNSNITLRATDFFELKPGFEVPLGAEINFIPTPCY